MSDRRCPRCTFTLVAQPMGADELDFCPRCHGMFIEQGEGSHLLGDAGDFSKWAISGSARPVGESRLKCPTGHGRMHAWRVEVPGGSIEVDTCTTCRGLWLDAKEALALKKAGRTFAPTPLPRFGPDLRLNEPPPGLERTGVAWYLFQLFTAMPVEVYNPKRQASVVSLGLILACVAVFAVELVAIGGGDEGFITRYGAVGADLSRGQNLQAMITHMFLHGGIAHLLGNMWFLWTFGDNIEDRVGRGRFLVLYLVFGLAALGLQLALTNDSTVPLVGASGAIAGLMGAYLALFPRAQLYQVFLFIRWRLPVWFYLGGWIALNAAIGVAELNHSIPETNVAWWAHVGGFAAGFLWGLLLGRSYRDGADLPRM